MIHTEQTIIDNARRDDEGPIYQVAGIGSLRFYSDAMRVAYNIKRLTGVVVSVERVPLLEEHARPTLMPSRSP